MKKKTLKNILFLFLCLALTAVLCIAAGAVLAPTDNDTAIARAQIRTFHSLPEDSLRVMSFGSSHNWRGMNASYFTEKGVPAYNYGCNWQHINTSQQFFHDALKSQHPEVVFVETYNINNLLLDMDMEGEIYYTRNLRPDLRRIEYLHQCFGSYFKLGRYLSYLFPIIIFHENWETISADNFRTNPGDYDFAKTDGALMLDEANALPYDWQRDGYEQYALEKKPRKILDDFVQICREENIRLIFYTAPSYGPFYYSEALAGYAEASGVEYLDLYALGDDAGIDYTTDFYDPDHLNTSGATKVAAYLYRYLEENPQGTM